MSSHPSQVILRRWKTIVTFSLIGLVIAVASSFIEPLQYASTVRLLVLQDVGNVDAYTASRSVELLAENFSTIVYTTTFYDQVMHAGFPINTTYFSTREDLRRKQWGKMVQATVTHGTGFLTLRVYHPNSSEAEQIVNAIAAVLQRDGWTYSPGGKVEVRLVDSALNSRWPVKPNIPVNGFSGFVLGGLVGVGYVFLQTDRIRRRHQLVHGEE